MVLRQSFGCFLVFLLAISYTQYEENQEDMKKAMGLLCCVVTIMFFAAPLASLMHVIKVKNSESLPFPIILSTLIVSMQWYIYGYLLSDLFIQVKKKLKN